MQNFEGIIHEHEHIGTYMHQCTFNQGFKISFSACAYLRITIFYYSSSLLSKSQSNLSTSGYSRKNEGVRIYNFQGHLRNSKWNFTGLFKNNVVLPGVLVLSLKISEGCNNFVEFLGVRFVLNPPPPFVCFLNSLY